MKSCRLNLLEPSEIVQACTGIDLPFCFDAGTILQSFKSMQHLVRVPILGTASIYSLRFCKYCYILPDGDPRGVETVGILVF